MPKSAYLSRIGLSQWVQTMSMVSWVIGGAARPLKALTHSLTHTRQTHIYQELDPPVSQKLSHI